MSGKLVVVVGGIMSSLSVVCQLTAAPSGTPAVTSEDEGEGWCAVVIRIIRVVTGPSLVSLLKVLYKQKLNEC